VVVEGAVQSAAPLSGIVRCRSWTGEGRESVRAVEGREVVADRGKELGAQQRPDAGHVGHDVGQLVGPEAGLDEPVDLGDLLVQDLDLMGECPNELGTNASILPPNGPAASSRGSEVHVIAEISRRGQS
jgi:hypothetical protein